VAELAEGRVWSGREAQARGLVDTLGGYEAALAELRGLLSGGPVEADFDAPLVVHPSPRRGGALWNARIGSGSGFSEALTLFELAASGAGALAYAASVPRLTL
jgi:ClpP class serine protease